MFSKRKLTLVASLCALIWIVSSLYLTQYNVPEHSIDSINHNYIPNIVSLDADHVYVPYAVRRQRRMHKAQNIDLSEPNIPDMLSEYIPDVSSIISHKYDNNNIPSSLHTIPSLFIISAPKSGSSSLIKWLVNTEEIFGDYALTPHRVENNMLANFYVDELITRNDRIGFYLSDAHILGFNDERYILSYTEKPPTFTEKRRRKGKLQNFEEIDAHKRKFRKRWSRVRHDDKQRAFDEMKNNNYLENDETKNDESEGTFSRMLSIIRGRKLLGRFEPAAMHRRRFSVRGRRRRKGRLRMFESYHLDRNATHGERDSFIQNTSAKQTYYTVGKSVFYFHLPYMARIFAIKYPNTKILITIREPTARIKSSFLFFIGDEYRHLADRYGDVNVYLQHIMEHQLLKQPFDDIKNGLIQLSNAHADDAYVNVTKWYDIYRSYKVFLVNMMRVCKEEFALMGYGRQHIIDSCKENDVVRSAFVTSCYIVPIMYWYMINVNTKRNFRLIQSELMFKAQDEYISKILCWVQTDDENCKAWTDQQWKTQSQWRKSEAKKDDDSDIRTELKNKIKEELMQCNNALQRFIEWDPNVQLSPFDLSLWD